MHGLCECKSCWQLNGGMIILMYQIERGIKEWKTLLCFKSGERLSQEGYEALNEAIKVAEENIAEEIEETIWENELDYQMYELADTYRTVWKK